jgi:putative membrane protein
MFMWMPVLSPLPEIPRLEPLLQMLYLFLQSVIPTIPAAFLTMAEGRPLYHAYEKLPKLFGLTAIEDQRTAGIIMKLGGNAIIWTFIISIFFTWATREEREDMQAEQEWMKVRRELILSSQTQEQT